MIFGLRGCDKHVVDVNLDVPAYLFTKYSYHQLLIGGSHVLKAEGHGVVAIGAV